SAADVGNNHADITQRQPEYSRDFLPQSKRPLGRCPDRHTVFIEVRDTDVAFHRIVMRAGKIKSILENKVGGLKSRLDVAALVAEMMTNIALLMENIRSAAAVLRRARPPHGFMNQWRIVGERFFNRR